MSTPATRQLHQSAQHYYGETLGGTEDLKTNACCSGDAIPDFHKPLLKNIDEEILAKFYGCGSPIPPGIEGATVLDLGCGTGRDVYLASQLAGAGGRVIGVDMTPEQLAVAKSHLPGQMKRFGFDRPNVAFHQGKIEDLAGAGITDNSIDLVISNCVINLSPDKRAVFREIFRVLKPGGELYFSDVFADRRLPEELLNDPVLHGECLSGAMYKEDFRRLLLDLGCPDFRVVESRILTIDDSETAAKLEPARFFSVTLRAFKLSTLEDRCENYGQTAKYLGTLPECAEVFHLDDHHAFSVGMTEEVCGNTAAFLEETRYGKHFEVTGDRSRHYGLFDCGTESPAAQTSGVGGCC